MFNPWRKHFNQRLRRTNKMIWDLEFQMFQRKFLREEIRKSRDRLVEVVSNYQKIEKLDEKQTADLEKKKKDVTEIENQIKLLDDEINGANPEMEPSFQSKIDGAHDLKKLLEMFVEQKTKQ